MEDKKLSLSEELLSEAKDLESAVAEKSVHGSDGYNYEPQARCAMRTEARLLRHLSSRVSLIEEEREQVKYANEVIKSINTKKTSEIDALYARLGDIKSLLNNPPHRLDNELLDWWIKIDKLLSEEKPLSMANYGKDGKEYEG